MKGTIPIGQSYFTAGEDSRFSGGIIISLPLKISRLGIRMNTALCRYPLSLPTRGYSSAGAPEMIFRAMETRREALKVIAFDGALPVNLPAGWIPKNGMPYAVFENSFSNFGEYVRSLRKNQRHSVLKSLKKWQGIRVETTTGTGFTEGHYALYQDTQKASRYQLGHSLLEFFTDLPLRHKYYSAYFRERLIGWILLIEDGDQLFAPVCGLARDDIRHFDTWKNLHLTAIRETIELKRKSIDFGDTAELGKVRLGCSLRQRSLAVRHTSKAWKFILSHTGWLDYPGASRWMDYWAFKNRPRE